MVRRLLWTLNPSATKLPVPSPSMSQGAPTGPGSPTRALPTSPGRAPVRFEHPGDEGQALGLGQPDDPIGNPLVEGTGVETVALEQLGQLDRAPGQGDAVRSLGGSRPRQQGAHDLQQAGPG